MVPRVFGISDGNAEHAINSGYPVLMESAGTIGYLEILEKEQASCGKQRVTLERVSFVVLASAVANKALYQFANVYYGCIRAFGENAG